MLGHAANTGWGLFFPQLLEGGDGIQPVNLTQQCGRWIDPTTLKEVGYVTVAGVITDSFKGFICPFGQTCVVRNESAC